jgi:hypothetical protein
MCFLSAAGDGVINPTLVTVLTTQFESKSPRVKGIAFRQSHHPTIPSPPLDPIRSILRVNAKRDA